MHESMFHAAFPLPFQLSPSQKSRPFVRCEWFLQGFSFYFESCSNLFREARESIGLAS